LKKSSLDDIVVLSYFDKCVCGKIIPYGQSRCKGHGRIHVPYLNRTCFYCHRITYSYKGKYPQWRHDENTNLICKRCYDRHWRANDKERLIYSRTYHMLELSRGRPWRINNRDYMKLYQTVMQPRISQLRRVRTAIKRGWGWVS
jgi:hypothetical protein